MESWGNGSKRPIQYRDGAQGVSYGAFDWQYRDRWYGGEPFSGITTISFEKRVCWAMTYWGRVLPDMDKERIYDCLRPALAAVDPEAPWRGPREIEAGGNCFTYRSSSCGDIVRFEGSEDIVDITGHILYEARFMGGFVNLE